MPTICDRLKPFTTLTWPHCREPRDQGQGTAQAAGAGGVKEGGSPCEGGAGAGAEPAFPGEAQVPQPSPWHQPQRAAGASRHTPAHSVPARGAAREMFSFYPRWFPVLERSHAPSCTLPQLPGPVLGLSAFVPLPGTWPSGVRPEPKERWRERCCPQQAGDGGPAGAPRKQRQSLAQQRWQCRITLSAVLPGARGREQLRACPALVSRHPAFPHGCSCPKPARDGEGRRRVGRAVVQTLANVTLSYFKLFISLPSDKNVLWSRAYHGLFGTWGGQRGADRVCPAGRRCGNGGCCRRSHRRWARPGQPGRRLSKRADKNRVPEPKSQPRAESGQRQASLFPASWRHSAHEAAEDRPWLGPSLLQVSKLWIALNRLIYQKKDVTRCSHLTP